MYKDLLLHVDTEEAGARRLAATINLAKTFDAKVTGLFVDPPNPALLVPEAALAAPAVLAQAETLDTEAGQERLDLARGIYEKACSSAGVEHDWMETRGPVAPVLALYAHTADLVVLGEGRTTPNTLAGGPQIAADVVLAAGRPTLVLPDEGEWLAIGKRILVAWTASRESARALHDALPLLQGADHVKVRTVTEENADPPTPAMDVARHLERHGIEAEWQRGPADGDVAAALREELAAEAYDLLVMGAYGHSRLREFVFGGTTRDLLHDLPVPTLLSS